MFPPKDHMVYVLSLCNPSFVSNLIIYTLFCYTQWVVLLFIYDPFSNFICILRCKPTPILMSSNGILYCTAAQHTDILTYGIVPFGETGLAMQAMSLWLNQVIIAYRKGSTLLQLTVIFVFTD